jgi:hypothetical protein
MRITAAGLAALALVPLLAGTPAAANETLSDQLLESTTELITNLDAIGWPEEAAYNRYTGTSETTNIVFGEPGDPESYLNATRCATFVRRLMTHRFDWATADFFTTSFGASYPNSAKFHDAFNTDRTDPDHIDRIRGYELRVAPYFTLRAGDLMAIKYIDAPGSDSGHMAIIGEGSHLYSDSHPDYREWAIRVLDSTSSAHGNPANQHGFGDTRFYYDEAGEQWKEATGAGMGWMFIRTSRINGGIISHRWSRTAATWYDVSARPVLFGRLDPSA